ncbi:hypothetical protein KP509_30G017600 [Ceratopteris richardii]|nr:hypothetical protein KP509_30G017600 [Ceratopteris richardii]
MKDDNVTPDAITYACILKACGSMSALNQAKEVHDEIVRQGLLANNVILANALVDIYVKCGVLALAKQVLDELPVRSVVSWTTLIAGYSQHGKDEDALLCFDQLQQDGLSPNIVTYTCTLKACSNIGAIDKGMELHSEISRLQLLEQSCALGTTLVAMYAKSGTLTMAQGVFDEIPYCDEVCWTALIAAYTDHGHCSKALQIFSQMCAEGFSLNAVTLTCALKACGDMRSENIGQFVHAMIIREDFLEGDGVLGNSLLDMYVKCGYIKKAEGIFEELPSHDMASWTTLVTGYSHHGHDEKSLLLFRRMKSDGFCLDAKGLVCMLQACGNEVDVKIGEEIHAEIIKGGLVFIDDAVGVALLNMYVKCGALPKAQQVFQELRFRDVVSWNALITGYCKHGYAKRAISCLELMEAEGHSPDEVTILCALQACGSIGAIENGKHIQTMIADEGLHEMNLALGNASLDMYMKCGELPKAQEFFDGLPFQDVVTWNTLLLGYCQNGFAEEVLNSLCLMERGGLFPDRTTFSCILKACGSLRDIEKGKKIHIEVARQGLLLNDVVLGNVLVDMYAKCGELQYAHQVFNELPVKDKMGWTSLIAGHCECGANKEALQCFQQMKHKGFPPDAVTFACVLKACGNMGAVEAGTDLHMEIANSGLLEIDNMVGCALLNMYIKCGSLEMAEHVFENLPSHNVVLWTSLVAGYARSGQHDTVFTLLNRMMKEGVEPNMVTYTVVLTACSVFGLMEEGHQYFESIEATSDHYMCMVNLFGRSGNLEKAMEVIDKLPLSHNLMAWSILLNACQKTGNIELGRLAFWPRSGVG